MPPLPDMLQRLNPHLEEKKTKPEKWPIISYAIVWKATQRCILMFKDEGPILVDFQTGNLFEGGAVDLGHKPSWLDL